MGMEPAIQAEADGYDVSEASMLLRPLSSTATWLLGVVDGLGVPYLSPSLPAPGRGSRTSFIRTLSPGQLFALLLRLETRGVAILEALQSDLLRWMLGIFFVAGEFLPLVRLFGTLATSLAEDPDMHGCWGWRWTPTVEEIHRAFVCCRHPL